MTMGPPALPARPSSELPTDTGSGRPPLLEVENLTVTVTPPGERRRVNVITGISFGVSTGEAVGLVGESGSGKSLTLRAILGLLPAGADVTSGAVRFEGLDLLTAGKRVVQRIRGTGITMIFQEPMTALNPVVRVGEQIVDAARRQLNWSRKDSSEHALRLARHMGIRDPDTVLSLYPHELSGGLRQRVMIAAALACQPRLVLCDEPTTALDVTIQAQIVGLLAQLRHQTEMSLLYVTHDLAVVAQLCQRLEVMYAGRIVEKGSVAEIFRSPRHPYTLGLVRATPDVHAVVDELVGIPGSAPHLGARPGGCAFHPRCGFATSECSTTEVPLLDLGHGRASACIHVEACERATQGLEPVP
jgi:oligopeptide/dipeptide ABC transporter ATP-binding protein